MARIPDEARLGLRGFYGQQLQKRPTAGDIRFCNMLARRAEAPKDKGIWLKPVDLTDYEIITDHDSAWAHAHLDLAGESGFSWTKAEHEQGEMTGTQRRGRPSRRNPKWRASTES